MRWRTPLIVVGVVFILLLATVVAVGLKHFLATPEQFYAGPKHFAFYAEQEAYGNLAQAEFVQGIKEKVYGGIVSHHLLAGDDIGAFFAELRDQKIKTVVIVGPNHYGVGSGKILASEYPYETAWGMVYPDLPIIGALKEQGVLAVDEIPFTKEHSISALVSYVAHHLPDAQVVPIVIRGGTDLRVLHRLATSLNATLPADAVVIASVDFSHHLSRTAAQFHDALSVSAIANADIPRVLGAEVDSPASLAVLLAYLDARGAEVMHSKQVNAADIVGNPAYDDVTSYLFAHFTKGAARQSHSVTTLNFGDLMLDRGVRNFMDKGGDPFANIRGVEGNFLKGADFIVANLEGPITRVTECQQKAYSFRFNPETANLLRREGFNAVNLGNNHSNDCFRQGFLDTRRHLGEAGVAAFGGHRVDESYITRTIGNTNVAFVGIDETGSSDDALELFYKKITELKHTNEHLIVHIHWGFEYTGEPSARQVEIGHRLVDSGADVVIGHHPHVVQTIERYKSGTIFYSLGNFIFDQTTKETKLGYGVGTAYENGALSFFLFPYTIKNFQPTLMPYAEMKEFCDKILKDLSPTDMCQFFSEI